MESAFFDSFTITVHGQFTYLNDDIFYIMIPLMITFDLSLQMIAYLVNLSKLTNNKYQIFYILKLNIFI